MSSYWQDVAERHNGLYETGELEATAYRLVTEQVLSHSDIATRKAYGMAELYERDYNRVLAPLGVRIKVNRQFRYAVAIPAHEGFGQATANQTRFALVLRGIYEERAREGSLTDTGDVLCDLIELQEHHLLMTGRELPSKGEFESLMRLCRRWGIARKLDEVDSSEGCCFPTPKRRALLLISIGRQTVDSQSTGSRSYVPLSCRRRGAQHEALSPA